MRLVVCNSQELTLAYGGGGWYYLKRRKQTTTEGTDTMNENTREQAMEALRTIRDAVFTLCSLTNDEDLDGDLIKERFACITTRAVQEVAAAYGENYWSMVDELLHLHHEDCH